MDSQSRHRVAGYGEMGNKLRQAYRQLQIDCQKIATMAGGDPNASYRLQAYYSAAATRVAAIFQALEAIAQLEIEWQGEAQRWLAGMPPSILQPPPALQTPQQPPPQVAVAGGAAPDPMGPAQGGIFSRNAVPQGAQQMPVVQHPVVQVPGVGAPAQAVPQPMLTQPQGGMVKQAPTQAQGLPVVQFDSPQAAAQAQVAAHAVGEPIVPPPNGAGTSS